MFLCKSFGKINAQIYSLFCGGFFQEASMRTGAGLVLWWSHMSGPEVPLTGEHTDRRDSVCVYTSVAIYVSCMHFMSWSRMSEPIQMIVCVHACVFVQCVYLDVWPNMCFTNCLILVLIFIHYPYGIRSLRVMLLNDYKSAVCSCARYLFCISLVRPLHEIVAVTHVVYVIFKAERAPLILRLMQHCTFTHENWEHQNTGANVIRHQRLYGRLSRLSFISPGRERSCGTV